MKRKELDLAKLVIIFEHVIIFLLIIIIIIISFKIITLKQPTDHRFFLLLCVCPTNLSFYDFARLSGCRRRRRRNYDYDDTFILLLIRNNLFIKPPSTN